MGLCVHRAVVAKLSVLEQTPDLVGFEFET